MKRTIDRTPITCKLCGNEYSIGGFRTHLQNKHKEYNTEKYVNEFGEFRPKVINEQKLDKLGGVECLECGIKLKSHKKLMHHISVHNMNYEEYHIKHTFNGVKPKCKCGCGNLVKIIKGGLKTDNGRIYAREFLSGHNTSMQVGVQTRSYGSRMKMRQSAINRMERDGKRFSPKISSAQTELFNYVNGILGGFKQNDTKLLSGREVDILNDNIKLGIEYNGLTFHSDKYRDRKYHISKLKEVERNGYRLIYIWEDWWLRKNEIIKSMLTVLLKRVDTKIYARKCEVKEIDDITAKTFLNKTHIQGGCVSKVRLGLFHDNELVSVMTFGKLRRVVGHTSKDNHWELLRFSSELNTIVCGGASKLLNYFTMNYNPVYILSYANRDWSVGNLYNTLGFNFVKHTEPGYFYAKGKRRFNRFQFTKHKLISMGYDANKSESEIMDMNGYMKIWDTGNSKFEWIK
jgi:hypothetical protein